MLATMKEKISKDVLPFFTFPSSSEITSEGMTQSHFYGGEITFSPCPLFATALSLKHVKDDMQLGCVMLQE